MALRIEDYALIGDTQSAGLVGNDGSIDWLCLPRFDSGACFAALLGDRKNGRWIICPEGKLRRVRRTYRPGTLVLETEFETEEGVVRIIDCMPPRDQCPDVVRLVEGVRGKVSMRMELIIRFDYGSIIPWVRRIGDGLEAIAGPDALFLRSGVETGGKDLTTVAEFSVAAGQRVPFVLSWHASHVAPPNPVDAEAAIRETEAWWREWSGRCRYRGPWQPEVSQSLIFLKALTYGPTGGIVAAPTTSVPEQLGGVRNWDYRYCWLRDATFTLYALMQGGYLDEARAWRDWLLRAVAGDPADLQVMYGVAGERRLPERILPHLAGYEGSSPVRIGNAAVNQFQLDIYGEVVDALQQSRHMDPEPESLAWALQTALLNFLESAWGRPDEGIWEVRGPRQHFTHSKVMAWVAFDRAVRAIERLGLEGPIERWRALRDEIHREVCQKAWDSQRRSFTQYYGSKTLDASSLLLPLVGFLPATDPRVASTVEAISRELSRDGFILRYSTEEGGSVDGLPPGEGVFLACTFWFADNLSRLGRYGEARTVFERLLALRNDVGLLSEEYDPRSRRLVGNFPQAFSHVGVINTARNLSATNGPAQHRQEG